eukprot:1428722-Rhodomonas_salina.1
MIRGHVPRKGGSRACDGEEAEHLGAHLCAYHHTRPQYNASRTPIPYRSTTHTVPSYPTSHRMPAQYNTPPSDMRVPEMA